MLEKISSYITSVNATWASTIIAFIALVISLYSNSISKKSYKLSKEIEDNNAPTLNMYIVNKVRYISTKKFYQIELLVTNLSRLTNSLNRVELEVFYSKNEVLYSIILEHDHEIEKLLPEKFKCSYLPVNIETGKSNKGLYYFNYDLNLLDNVKIVKYRVRLTDSYGKVYTDDFTLICEVQLNGEDEKN